jgi:hypothetical protein
MAGRKLTVLPALGAFPAADDLMYVVDVSDTSESPQGTSKAVEFSDIMAAGKIEISPVVTDGDGTATDFTLMYQITGNIVDVSGFCREYEIADGDDVLTVELDLTGTALEPAANFTGAFQLTGGAAFSEHSQGGGTDVLQSISINTVTLTKKLQIAVSLEAPLSGDTFNTTMSFSIKYERVVTP